MNYHLILYFFQNQDVSKKCSKEEKILKSRSLYDAVSDVEVGFIT